MFILKEKQLYNGKQWYYGGQLPEEELSIPEDMIVVTSITNAKKFQSYQQAQQELDKFLMNDLYDIIEVRSNV